MLDAREILLSRCESALSAAARSREPAKRQLARLPSFLISSAPFLNSSAPLLDARDPALGRRDSTLNIWALSPELAQLAPSESSFVPGSRKSLPAVSRSDLSRWQQALGREGSTAGECRELLMGGAVLPGRRTSEVSTGEGSTNGARKGGRLPASSSPADGGWELRGCRLSALCRIASRKLICRLPVVLTALPYWSRIL